MWYMEKCVIRWRIYSHSYQSSAQQSYLESIPRVLSPDATLVVLLFLVHNSTMHCAVNHLTLLFEDCKQ